jgi:hypothetical protein
MVAMDDIKMESDVDCRTLKLTKIESFKILRNI